MPICATEYPASLSTSDWNRVQAMPENVTLNASSLTGSRRSLSARAVHMQRPGGTCTTPPQVRERERRRGLFPREIMKKCGTATAFVEVLSCTVV